MQSSALFMKNSGPAVFLIPNKTACNLKQNKNNLFLDPYKTVRCLWCEDLACNWLQHKHSRHISGVHAFICTAVVHILLR